MDATEIELMVLLTDTEISRASLLRTFLEHRQLFITDSYSGILPYYGNPAMRTLDSLYLPRLSVLGCITQCWIQTLR